MSKPLALALALLTAAGAAWAGNPSSHLLTVPETDHPSWPPVTSLSVMDASGRAILTVDGASKTITVPDDVNVNDAARRVFDVLIKEYLPQCRGAP